MNCKFAYQGYSVNWHLFILLNFVGPQGVVIRASLMPVEFSMDYEPDMFCMFWRSLGGSLSKRFTKTRLTLWAGDISWFRVRDYYAGMAGMIGS